MKELTFLVDLLFEGRKAWLCLYFVGIVTDFVLYWRAWENPIGKMAAIMLFGALSIILIIFFLIILFRWKTFCATISTIAYLGFVIYEERAGNLCEWYITLPICLLIEIYMLWNLGGVVNCMIASVFREKLANKIILAKESYNDYSEGIKKYNELNQLGFWTRVKTKKEPDWEMYRLHLSGTHMFSFVNAVFGISTSEWEEKEKSLTAIITNLEDKKKVIDSNHLLYEERESIERIVSKEEGAGINSNGLEKQGKRVDRLRKKNLKKGRLILKRKL